MTVWILECTKCKTIREVDLGFNLYKIEKLYIYCSKCKQNTFHKIVKHLEE